MEGGDVSTQGRPGDIQEFFAILEQPLEQLKCRLGTHRFFGELALGRLSVPMKFHIITPIRDILVAALWVGEPSPQMLLVAVRKNVIYSP
jgi:hypothetical protein